MKISDLGIGAYLVFGRFPKSGERGTPDLLWRKATNQNGFYTETNIGRFSADALEPDNESRDRRERGSNFYPQTNIFQMLNSEDEDWYRPQHEADAASEKMMQYPGFLHLFEDWERKMIVPHEIVSVVPAGFKRKFGEQVKSVVKVSIPSKSQLLGGEDTTEGTRFDIFELGGAMHSDVLTRTSVGTGLYAVGRNGKLINFTPANEVGVCPFIQLDGDSEVEYDAVSKVYYTVPPQEYIKAITDELHQLLK